MSDEIEEIAQSWQLKSLLSEPLNARVTAALREAYNLGRNNGIDAAAEAILISDEDHLCDCDECAFIKRILALKVEASE